MNIKKDKKKNQIDIIYWINMDKSIDRRKHMQKLLKNDIFNNIEKKRINAIDGSKLNFESNIYSIFKNLNLKKYNFNEYACLFSHLNTLFEFSQSNYNIALIFEDDVSLEYKKYWTTSLNEVILNAPKDWEILQLCVIIDTKDFNSNDYGVLSIKENPKSLYKKISSFSSAAYIINKKAVIRFLKPIMSSFRKYGKIVLDKKISHHADIYMYTKMKKYVYKYPLFTYLNKESLLHPNHLNSHTYSKKVLYEIVKKHYYNVKKLL